LPIQFASRLRARVIIIKKSGIIFLLLDLFLFTILL
jgi:hypothetical protein